MTTSIYQRGDGGAVAKTLIARMRDSEERLAPLSLGGGENVAAFTTIHSRLSVALVELNAVVEHMVGEARESVKEVYAGSVAYLRLTGIVLAAGRWHAQPSSRSNN